MTTYDAKGMPQFATSDKIAANGDGLREDLNLISASAAAAIGAEGGRAESAAKAYADSKDASNRSAWAAADAAKLAEAKAYTDQRDDDYRTVDRALWRSEDDGHQAAAEANAKAYVDGKKFVPEWKATTAYTAGQRVVAPNGDVVSAKVDFTSGTTYAASNWNASTQDGRLATIEGTAVFKGDPRLLGLDDVEGVLFSVVDQNDKRTALEIGLNGDFTPYAAGRIGASLGVTDAALDSGEKFAVVDANDRVVFSDVAVSGASTTPAYPSADWAHWGDSLTDNAVTGTDAWVNQLSALTGKNHYNGGWYQQRHDQIAARQGGLPAIVTVTGNATASSGATTVTTIVNKPILASGTRYVLGKLAGIPGTLAEPTSGNVQFTPDVAGVYPVPAGSLFIATDGANYRDRTVTIWAGRNSIYDTDPQIIVSAIRAMIDYLTPNVKRVMVMEIPPFTTDSSATRSLTAAINSAIKAAFPAHWLPIATWLRTAEAATAAGITFTAQDNTDIANGDTPSSFRSDAGHLNATGCKAVAYRVYQEAQKRGWL